MRRDLHLAARGLWRTKSFSAAAGARLLRGVLFGIDALDPTALLAAALLSMAGSALACYWPVRRATRIDSVAILRN